jgi:anti-anti-sigma regulatory factor
MPFSIVTKQGRQTLHLEGSVTIRHAAQLAESWGENQPVAVDTSELQDIDTCILQLLCSLGKSGPALLFHEPSTAFAAAVDRCGLRRELLNAREAL